MKRIILFLAAAVMATSLLAQTSQQVNFKSLQKKVDKSNVNLKHEKKSLKYKTWLSHGELMLDVYDAMILSSRTGMSISEFNLIVGKPNEQKEFEAEGNTITEYKMDRVNFYFINGVLEYWTFTDNLVEQPLNKAYDSFMKARELDEKGKANKNLTESLNKLRFANISEGTSDYAKKDYKIATEHFGNAVKIGEDPLVAQVDTVVIYYTGLSAQLATDYETAIKFYKKAIEYGYDGGGGNIYYNLFEAYQSLDKAEEGLQYLENGFVKYPQNQSILYGLINYYINKGEDPSKVLEYIHKAMEVDVNSPSLYFAEGMLQDKLGNFEAAENSYKKAIEIKPDFFDALYNIGVLYYNKGVKYIEEANLVPAREVERYDSLLDKASIEFKHSLPYMEKTYELDTSNEVVLETLRTLYFRFRNESQEYQDKYDKFNKIIKGE